MTNQRVNNKGALDATGEKLSATHDIGSSLPNDTEVSSAQEREKEITYDRGLKAWLQVFGAFFLWFNTWGIINAYGSFQTYYEQNLLSHISPSTISWVGSVQSALLMLFSVVVGPLFDAGHFVTMLSAGTFLQTFGFMMCSISTQYWQIMLSQGICIGLGSGFLFLPAIAVIPQYFRKRKSLVNGIAAIGASVGGVLYPLIFHQLQQRIGFGWATRALGFLALVTGAISVGLLRLRFKPKERRVMLQLSAFKEPQYSVFCLACFLGFVGFYNFLVYIQPYAIETGAVSDNIAFYLLAILNATSSLGRLLPGLAADYIGPVNMMTPCLAATTAVTFCWIAAKSMAGIVSLSALYGFFSGGFVSLVGVGIISISKDAPNIGARLGMCFGAESVGLLIGTPLGGAILSRSSYLGLQIFSGMCLAISTILFATVRLLDSGMKFRYKL